MSKGIIQDKINQIATETEFEGVTHVEVAELLTLINNDKVDKTEAVAYESGFQGSITPDTLPASGWIPGIYAAEVSGNYRNIGGIDVDLNEGYTALLFDGERWSKIVLPIDVNGIIPDWSDEETDLQFPKTRIFENFIYRVKPGQTATSVDVPGISDKWEIINQIEIENSEYLKVWYGGDGKVALGIRKDRSVYARNINVIEDLIEKIGTISEIEASEFLEVKTDRKGNIIYALTKSGDIYAKNITTIEEELKKKYTQVYANIPDVVSVIVDENDNILSQRNIDGTLEEHVGVVTPTVSISEKLDLSPEAFDDFVEKFSDTKIGINKSDLSSKSTVLLPFPKSFSCINLNITAAQLPTAKPTKIVIDFEYWDKSGNYLKKPGLISVQGDSSSGHLRKGFTLDITDAKLGFDNLVPADSYFLKSYYTDAFRGLSIMAYRLFKDVNKTRSFTNQKAFYNDYAATDINNGKGTLAMDMSSGANYIADGFPVALYCKDVFYGMYCLVQKKNRDNFDIKKATAKHVWLDGYLSPWFFFSNNIDWTAFEIRNPGSLKNLDGTDYDGDNPKEIAASTTKTYIQNFASRIGEITSKSTLELKRSTFLKYFDLNSCIDYFLTSNLIYNNDGFAKNWQWYTKDGVKWAVAVHDLDNIFGTNWKGNFIDSEGIENTLLGTEPNSPMNLVFAFFKPEITARFQELKTLGIFTDSYVAESLKKWLDQITYNMLKKDLEAWPETPTYRDSKTNSEYWVCVAIEGNYPDYSATANYVVGDKVKITGAEHAYIFKCKKDNTGKNPITGTYANSPYELGFYNSIDRVRQVVVKRLAVLNSNFN